MLKIVKNCSSSLVMFSKNINQIIKFFEENLIILDKKYIKENSDRKIKEIYSKSTGNDTIIFLSSQMEEAIKFVDVDVALLLNHDLDYIVISLLNNNINKMIKKIRQGPELVMMKNYGNIDKFVESIKSDFKGEIGNCFNLLEKNNSGTIIGITNNDINKRLDVDKLYEKAIYTNADKKQVLNRINVNSIKYINESINKKGWYEYQIDICDNYQQYDYHYQRLIFIIDQLNLGLVLKKGTYKSLSKKLLNVTQNMFNNYRIFSVLLYSTIDKEKLKSFLMGIEYLDNLDKIVDINLYCNGKKVKWTQLKDDKKKTKEDIIDYSRKRLLKRFNHYDKEKLENMENKILKLR